MRRPDERSAGWESRKLFVFICGHTRKGKFQLRRKSRRDRMRAKLREVKENELRVFVPRSRRKSSVGRRGRARCSWALTGSVEEEELHALRAWHGF